MPRRLQVCSCVTEVLVTFVLAVGGSGQEKSELRSAAKKLTPVLLERCLGICLKVGDIFFHGTVDFQRVRVGPLCGLYVQYARMRERSSGNMQNSLLVVTCSGAGS